MARIYVASSWRNDAQPDWVATLRGMGHEVYDFREPRNGEGGFHWEQIDPEWREWGASQFKGALGHPVARRGFRRDKEALLAAEGVLLVLPCGRSAHLEAGFAAGRGIPTCVLLASGGVEPELMYRFMTVAASISDVLTWLQHLPRGAAGYRSGPWEGCNGRPGD